MSPLKAHLSKGQSNAETNDRIGHIYKNVSVKYPIGTNLSMPGCACNYGPLPINSSNLWLGW